MKRGSIHILLVFILFVSLVVLILLGTTGNLSKLWQKQPETNTVTSLKSQQNRYQSTYWGFGVNYPQSFKAIETYDGVILANYGWSNNKPNYKLTMDDIEYKISVVDQTFDKPWYSSRQKIEEYKKFLVNEKYITFYEVANPSPERGAYPFIAAEIIHDGFTYRFHIEKGESKSGEHIQKISESFKFIPKDEYLPPQNPISNGMKRYLNTRWGFAFDYPESWNIEDFDPIYTVVDAGGRYTHLTIQLLPRYLSLSGDFLEDIKKETSLQCAADGPGSSIYCPEEEIKTRITKNVLGMDEYIIERKKIFETNNVITTSIDEVVVAFPLSIQQYYAIIFSPLGLSPSDDNEAVLEVGNNFQKLQKK